MSNIKELPNNIIKGLTDDRTYYTSTLKNNIKYYIVTDKTYTETFVMFFINSGSYNNPVGYDGLAHFLEHLIFFGSEKYPNVNLLTEIAQNGGSSNAYTSPFETGYYFTVLNDYVERTIDIFSSALEKPLFLEKDIKAEINAVNNEYLNTIQNDGQIINYFKHTLMNEPQLQLLTIGNTKTLNKPDLLKKIREYYNNNYTSDNISVCVYTSLPKDDIEKILITYLSTIPNRKNKKKTYELLKKPIFTKNINTTYYIKSVKKGYNICYIWNIPNKLNHKQNKEFDIIEYLLSNDSKHSIINLLKNEGYLNHIEPCVNDEGYFYIYLSLTCNGLRNMDYVENVLLTFLNKIINNNNKKYAEYIQKRNKLCFDYIKDESANNIVDTLCKNTFYYDTPNLLYGDFKMDNILSDEEYKTLFKKYFDNNKILKIISTHKNPFYNTNKLKFYKNEYVELNHVISFNNKLDINIDINEIYNIDDAYLNINSDIIKIEEVLPTNVNTSWYYGNSTFNNRMVSIMLFFYKITNINTSLNYLLSSISVSIINYILNIELYDITESLFDVNLLLNNYLILNINAINDVEKIKIFIKKISNLIDKLSDDEYIKTIVSDIYIENIIIKTKQTIRNKKYTTPLGIADELFYENIYKYKYNYKKLLDNFYLINPNNIRAHIKQLFINSNFSSFIGGNIKNDESILSPFNTYNKKYFDITLNKDRRISIYQKHPNNKEKSIGLLYYYTVPNNLRNLVLMDLLNTILNQLFFDVLRTKHQLGYIVKMNTLKIKNEIYLTEKIQSDQNIYKLIELVEQFNNNIIKYINECNYDKYIVILKTKYKNPCNNLSEQITQYLNEIINKEFIFDRYEHMIKILESISKDDLIEFSKFINNNNKNEILII